MIYHFDTIVPLRPIYYPIMLVTRVGKLLSFQLHYITTKSSFPPLLPDCNNNGKYGYPPIHLDVYILLHELCNDPRNQCCNQVESNAAAVNFILLVVIKKHDPRRSSTHFADDDGSWMRKIETIVRKWTSSKAGADSFRTLHHH